MTFGFHTFAEQKVLYDIYKAGGPKAAPPEMSAHNYGLAFDVAVIEGSRTEDSDPSIWNTLGAVGAKHDLRWGNAFNDKPHFEHPDTPSGSTMKSRYRSGKDVLSGE